MRALGGIHRPDASSRALDYYWSALEDDVTVSLEALCGVVNACDHNDQWEDAMSILYSVLTKSLTTRWIVPGNELVIGPVNHAQSFRPDMLPRMGMFLSSVMSACNNAGQFATALLALRLLDLSLLETYRDCLRGSPTTT